MLSHLIHSPTNSSTLFVVFNKVGEKKDNSPTGCILFVFVGAVVMVIQGQRHKIRAKGNNCGFIPVPNQAENA